MDGIEILNKVPIMENSDCVISIVTISLIFYLAGLILFFIFSLFKIEILSMISILIGLLGFLSAIIFLPIKTQESGRYQYKCLVSDNVKLTEFYKKYNVVECDGKLWIIEDKENE